MGTDEHLIQDSSNVRVPVGGILRQRTSFAPVFCLVVSGTLLCGLGVLMFGCAGRERLRVQCGVYNLGCPITPLCEQNPPHSATTNGFMIDRTLVAAGEYESCVDAGGCPPLTSRLSADPEEVALTTWAGAQAFCRFQGGHVPSSNEWEIAARGHSGDVYPWGNEWNPQKSAMPRHHRRSAHLSVEYRVAGSRPDVHSEFGLEDMIGNGPEFVSSGNRVLTRGCHYLFRPDESPETKCSLARVNAPPRRGIAAFRCAYPLSTRKR